LGNICASVQARCFERLCYRKNMTILRQKKKA
jgi:hypothetical protein